MTYSPLLLFAALTLATNAFATDARTAVEPKEIVRFVAIDNVCAWPNLQRMTDGSLAAFIFNQPSHGQREGDVECWMSERGEFWRKAGTPAPHEPHTNRMNHAVGFAGNGDLLVLCSAWADFPQGTRPKQAAFRDGILPPWICRSKDGGKTWQHAGGFTAAEAGRIEYIPYGDITRGADQALHVACYDAQLVDPEKSSKTTGWKSWHFSSADDGVTWKRVSLIGPKHNETFLLPLGEKNWLAAARGDGIDLFRSEDDGGTWGKAEPFALRGEVNAHLLRLKDGRLLITYTNRVPGEFGVLAKVSGDEGRTWGMPIRIALALDSDGGYPSSVQRADGRIVTGYYSRRSANHERYHMGVAIWEAERE